MTLNTQVLDTKSRLALACSALARAGQQLSVASSAQQARSALLQVATQLETDRNLATLIPVEEITRKCRDTASSTDEAPLVAACRQLATTLARRASSLAAEVQQKTTHKPAPAAAALTPVTAPPVEPAAPVTPPVPPTAAAPVALPTPAPTPAPVPTAKPRLDPARLRQISVATNPAEQEAVATALEAGKRFAVVGDATLIDTRTNRMWLAHPTAAGRYSDAVAAVSRLDVGGYRDWRLPSPDDLRQVLGDGGSNALRALGVLTGANSPLLWSSDLRSKFFGFVKKVTVANSGTGELTLESASSTRVQTLAIRGG
jgi:hypothetical protein